VHRAVETSAVIFLTLFAAPCSGGETRQAATASATRVEPFELEFLHPYAPGKVPYVSAHHQGADSELLVNAGHCCLDNRDVIGEVDRILREHVAP
jgi:hypothetical protein